MDRPIENVYHLRRPLPPFRRKPIARRCDFIGHSDARSRPARRGASGHGPELPKVGPVGRLAQNGLAEGIARDVADDAAAGRFPRRGRATQRWGPGPSVYLSSWFNTLRTSYGMALYARRVGNDKLLKLAGETVELALKAPGRDGAFKCVALPMAGGRPTLWAAGDGCGDITKDGFLGYDMCWTGYWLLKWRAAGLPGGEAPAALPALAQFLIARQAADGMLPTRFAEDGSVEESLSHTVKAETGPVVLFLLELYTQDANPAYLQAAGMDFLERQVIPRRQWYDYETFWSCSRRTPQFDERSQQWPANDLAVGQTVAAYLLASRHGRGDYLAMGESLLDYLLLYQQCWTNPVLEDLPARPCCWAASRRKTPTRNGPTPAKANLATC